MFSPLRRAAVATTAIAGLALALPGLAGAQNVIPGDTDPGKTIVTGQPGGTVTVDQVDRVTGKVSGTFVNESGMNLTCISPNANPNLQQRSATVSTADVIRASVEYYTLFQSGQSGGFNAGSNIIFVGNVGANVQFWPLLQLLPTGSAAQYLSDGTKEAAAIGNAHTEAKMRGMVGEVSTFNLNNGQTRNWETDLSRQSIGERGTDPLGALFVCRVGDANSQHYAWAGYEEVEEVPGTDTGSLGSFGALGGSLGSSDPAPAPDVDDVVDVDDDDVVNP